MICVLVIFVLNLKSAEDFGLSLETILEHEAIQDVDRLRANMYRLLARALSRPADKPFLEILSSLGGDGTELGNALGTLADAARATDVRRAAEEYQDLFIGLGRGEVLPYASYYLTGFLNEKPLARLRNRMAELGIERDPSVKEPEDHAGALMEMMAGLIEGDFGAPQPLDVQELFFRDHVASWIPHFYADLQKAKSAHLYSALGRVGELFIELEGSAFAM